MFVSFRMSLFFLLGWWDKLDNNSSECLWRGLLDASFGLCGRRGIEELLGCEGPPRETSIHSETLFS